MKDLNLTAEICDYDYKCLKCEIARLHPFCQEGSINPRYGCEKIVVENYVFDEPCRCGSNLFDLTLYIKLKNKPVEEIADEDKIENLANEIFLLLHTFPQTENLIPEIIKGNKTAIEFMRYVNSCKIGENK